MNADPFSPDFTHASSCDRPTIGMGAAGALPDLMNDGASLRPWDLCIHQLFEAQVKRTPEAVAITFTAASITYRE